jgi:beta-lactamase class A
MPPFTAPRVRGLLLVLLVVVTSALAFAQDRPARPGSAGSAASASLDEQVRALTAGFRGTVHIYAKNLDTGATYSLRGDDRVRTASTIKLPIMVTVFAQVTAGTLRWDQEVVLTKEKKAGGSGVLGELADGTRLTLRDAVHLMIVVSDNTATNLVLDLVTADAVNAQMDALGFKNTRSLRKVGGGGPSKANDDPVNKLFGLGVTTPHEMVTLLERLERGEIVSPDASREMVDILKREQYSEGIGRTLYDIPIASKSGALDRLRSDVAIVYSRRGRIAMAITVDDMPEVFYTVDNPGLVMISKLSLLLLDGLGQ